MEEEIGVGIDLGTTNSCVAIYQDGEVKTCLNDSGKNITPSYICFTATDCLIGEAAQKQDITHIEGAIFEFKRLIGRSFEDESVQSDMKNWPFMVIEENGRLKIQIKIGDTTKSFHPEDVSGMILKEMKKYAENNLKKEVKSAVITVPAYFNNAQRQATELAGKIAGLKVLRIINEPTAAAFAYGFHYLFTENDNKDRYIIVYHLGGKTFEVSILKIYNKTIRIIATGGDNHLGGVDFDINLLNYFLNDFKRKTKMDLREVQEKGKGVEKAKAQISITRMRNACEKTKIVLSSADEGSIVLDSLYRGHDYQSTIARSRFESLNSSLFNKTMGVLDSCLSESKAKIPADTTMEIVLVGGSTRIPKIQDLIKKKFPNSAINTNINPDEAVVYGAAIYADFLIKAKGKQIDDALLADVTPLTIGVDRNDGIMSVIIPKNTIIPIKKSIIYSTTIDNQETMAVKVFKGESKFVDQNDLLSEFIVTDIPLGKKGFINIEVIFSIEPNGILTALGQLENTQTKLTILSGKDRLSEIKITNINSEMHKIDNRKHKEALDAKCRLIKYIENMRFSLEKMLVNWREISYNMKENFVVGIDLGMSNSCVAIYQNEDIRSCYKSNIPSYIYYTANDCLIAETVKNQGLMGKHGVIYDFMRLIGRSYDDESFQNDMKNWPFKIIEEKSRLKIQINVEDTIKSFYPEEVCGTMLLEMKKIVENPSIKVNSAVITMPAHFNFTQRHAIESAGKLAGLRVLKVINETTAAVYALKLISNQERYVLVYNLGSKTFNATILKIHKEEITSLATEYDENLGGCDFDNELLNYFLNDFERKTKINLKEKQDSKDAISKMRIACEKVKIDLSFVSDVYLQGIYNNCSYEMKLTRSYFELLIINLVNKTMALVDMCVDQISNIPAHKKLEIIFVGSSTRIPIIRDIISEKFPESKVHKYEYFKNLVADGAAIYANMLIADEIKLLLAKEIDVLQKKYDDVKNWAENQTCNNKVIFNSEREVLENLYNEFIQKFINHPL